MFASNKAGRLAIGHLQLALLGTPMKRNPLPSEPQNHRPVRPMVWRAAITPTDSIENADIRAKRSRSRYRRWIGQPPPPRMNWGAGAVRDLGKTDQT